MGLKGVLDKLMFDLQLPLLCPVMVRIIGMNPLSGILLHGPPGCGKSTLACAIANEAGVPFYMVSASELVTGVSGMTSFFLEHIHLCCYVYAKSLDWIDIGLALFSCPRWIRRENQGTLL